MSARIWLARSGVEQPGRDDVLVARERDITPVRVREAGGRYHDRAFPGLDRLLLKVEIRLAAGLHVVKVVHPQHQPMQP